MESSEQQPDTPATVRQEPAVPSVSVERGEDAVRFVLTGELTDAARRPLVREVTDRLLAQPGLRRIDLDLRGVTFVNSAGLAVLVQVQKLAAPRAIEVALVAPTTAVVRPLQLTGLWHRFTIAEHEGASE